MLLGCITCSKTYSIDTVIYHCACGSLLEVRHSSFAAIDKATFDQRRGGRADIDVSGVWRFREAVLPVSNTEIVTHPEGGTRLYYRPELATWAGVPDLRFKHEGENPTGSFKDRGMTVAVTQAKRLNRTALACASTGNTSAALAAYGAQAGLKTLVFLPEGKVSTGKIAQAVGYGAICLMVKGDFDAAMRLAMEVAQLGVYLVNSVNPFRIEGQKTIIWEMLQDMEWQAPDWIVVPGGNLGNTSAFGKAIKEAHAAGWITSKPRIATIQAAGANPFYQSFQGQFARPHSVAAETVATAIRIGQPVNYDKAKRVISELNGVVAQVTDAEIMLAKRAIDRAGIGCEPASAATLAGLKQLVATGLVKASDRVVCVLTGHMLKDPEAVTGPDLKLELISPTVEAVRPFLV